MDGNASPTGTAGLRRNGHVSNTLLITTTGTIVVGVGLIVAFQMGPRFFHGSAGDSVSLQSSPREPAPSGATPATVRVQPTTPPTEPAISPEVRGQQAGLKSLALWVIDAGGRTKTDGFVAGAVAKDHELLAPALAGVLKDSRVLLNPEPSAWRRGDWGSGSDDAVALVVAVSRVADSSAKWTVTVVHSSSAVDPPELLTEQELLARVPWLHRGIPFDVEPPKAPIVLTSGGDS